MSFLTRVVDAAGGSGAVGRPTGVLVECPAVIEYLSSGAYPDGAARERAVLSVFAEDGKIKCCLNDRDTGRTLWRSADGIEDAVMALEVAIADGTADWRRASAARSGSGKRTGK